MIRRVCSLFSWMVMMVWVMLTHDARAQLIQTTATQHLVCPQDTSVVMISVTGFQNVASISLTLAFNPAKIAYVDYLSAHPTLAGGLFFVNNTGTNIKIAWFSITPVSFGSGNLVSLRFVHLGGFGLLHWDTLSLGACQYSDVAGNLIPAQFVDGFITAPGAVLYHPAPDTVTPNDTAIFSVVTYGATLTYRWQENMGSGWADVFNGFFYAGAGTTELKVLKPSLAFDGRQYRCRTTGTCPSPGNLDFSSPATLKVVPPCQNATTWAGNDTTICAGGPALLHGTATHYQLIQWTGGDGFFTHPNSLVTNYIPGVNDVQSGQVMLSLQAFAVPPCANATDQVLVTIQSCAINQAPVFQHNGMPVDTLLVEVYFHTPLNLCLELVDPENDSSFLSNILSGPFHGSITNFFDGDTCFDYTPKLLFLGTDEVKVTGCDLHGACDTLLIRFQVILPPNNLSPLAISGNQPIDTIFAWIAMNTGSKVCVDAFDPEGQPCDLSLLLNAPLHGTVDSLGSGDTCLYYTPDSLYLGTDTFTVSLCDTAGGCTPLVFILDVIDFQWPVPPVAVPDSCSLLEGDSTWCLVLLNDYDLNGDMDTSSLSITQPPIHGQVQVDTLLGRILYTPSPYFHGLDYFYYRICDDSNYCDTARVTLRVLPVFDPPRPDTFQTLEDHPLPCPVLDNDQYPFQVIDTATLQVLQQPKSGSATVLSNGQILYSPWLDYYGLDSFQYRVCDTLQMCGNAWVHIVIIPVNDPPRLLKVNGIIISPNQVPLVELCQDAPKVLCLTLYDPEGDAAFISGLWTSQPAATAVIQGSGDTCFLYQPAPAFSGMDTVYCVLSDSMDHDTILIIAKVDPHPFVTAGIDTIICSGSVFQAVNANGIGMQTIQWSTLGTGVFLDPTVLQAIYIPSMQDVFAGMVSLIIAVQGFPGCGASSDTLEVSFRPLPDIWLGKDTTLCYNASLQLDGGAGFQSWQWSTGHTGRFLLVDTTLVGIGTSAISVTVTDDHGCSNEDQISITFISCPGITAFESGINLHVYPNPSQGTIHVEWVGRDIRQPAFRFLSVHGMQQQVGVTHYNNSNGLSIHLGHLKPGVYILQLFSESHVISRKIILQ